MAKVITVMNMKGGVGKTTLCAHLAGMLPRFGATKQRRVLAIDYDPFKAFSDPMHGRGFVWSSGKPRSKRAFRNLLSVTRELVERLEL